ncbi:MAG: zf-HC2 domain-containing protein [Acidobacteria bacterium]|nr:zf-HC2 domain-containing protein [Acidobacteriota bacterium]
MAAHHSLLTLQDALDGRLDAADRAALDAHLATCEACRRQSQALRWTRLRLAGASAGVDVPPTLDGELRRLLETATAPPVITPPPPPQPATKSWWSRLRG